MSNQYIQHPLPGLDQAVSQPTTPVPAVIGLDYLTLATEAIQGGMANTWPERLTPRQQYLYAVWAVLEEIALRDRTGVWQ